jgi:hypothetical protein
VVLGSHFMKDISKVSHLISHGKINNLNDLYAQVSKADIARALNLNPTSFTNYRSNNPESFKLSEFIVLSNFFKVSLDSITSIFANSIDNYSQLAEKK